MGESSAKKAAYQPLSLIRPLIHRCGGPPSPEGKVGSSRGLLFRLKYAILLLQTFFRISRENANFLKAALHNLSAVLPQETGFYFVSKEQTAVGKAPARIYGSPGAAHCGGGGHCVLWTVQCPPAERHYGRRRAGHGAAAAPLVRLARLRHHAGAGHQLLSFGPEGFGAELYQVVRGLHFVRLRLFPAVGDLAALPAEDFSKSFISSEVSEISSGSIFGIRIVSAISVFTVSMSGSVSPESDFAAVSSSFSTNVSGSYPNSSISE